MLLWYPLWSPLLICLGYECMHTSFHFRCTFFSFFCISVIPCRQFDQYPLPVAVIQNYTCLQLLQCAALIIFHNCPVDQCEGMMNVLSLDIASSTFTTFTHNNTSTKMAKRIYVVLLFCFTIFTGQLII